MTYVVADLQRRNLKGIETYGEPLQVDNSRDHLWDAYEEALDLCMYLRAEIMRRNQYKDDGK